MRDDVGESLKAVLDYIGGRESKGDRFVDELKEAVGKAKMRKEWRREYMTLICIWRGGGKKIFAD